MPAKNPIMSLIKSTFLILIPIVSILSTGCSPEVADAVLKVNGDEFAVGDTIEVDATDSTYDSILWKQNGATISACADSDICQITLTESGSQIFSIEVEMGAQGTASIGLSLPDLGLGFSEDASTDKAALTIAVVDASDTNSPQNPGIVVNNNDSSVSSTTVTLTLSATDDTGITQYYVSEDSTEPEFSASGWVEVTSSASYAGDVSFTMSSASGAGEYTRTIYVWFMDAAGNISDVASDSITLIVTDTTSPTNIQISINSGASTTSTTAVTLSLSATDDVGVTGYYVSESSSTPSSNASGWQSITSTTSYSNSVSFSLTGSTTPGSYSRTVYAWYKDTVGNVSSSVSDSITLVVADSTVPSNASVSINSGNEATASRSVTLTLSATDDVGITGYLVSESSAKPASSDAGWVSATSSSSFSKTVDYSLSSGYGVKRVYAWFRDAAGNLSEAVNDSIVQDVTAWSFVDGNNATGLNVNTAKYAYTPDLAAYNSKMYVAWYEENTSFVKQIRVKVYSGSDASPSWSSVDGGGNTGINKDTARTAETPRLVVYNNILYATWRELNASGERQIRVSMYNANDASPLWLMVDGNGTDGLNYTTTVSAYDPFPVAFNSKLYLIWYELNAAQTQTQIRVSMYNGSTWTRVDGNGSNGINKDINRSAEKPVLGVFDSKLYAAWHESNGSAKQLRVAVYNGNDVAPAWSFVDGNGSTGININTAKDAEEPRLLAFNSKLYCGWHEQNSSSVKQVRLAVYSGNDGSPSWSFVDGNGANGLNKNTALGAQGIRLTEFNSRIYVKWQESYGAVNEIRVASYNGNENAPGWHFVDGNAATGLNKDTTQSAYSRAMLVFNSKLYLTWQEMLSGVGQVRVISGN
ncbi:MAG: hypothetical protein HQM12_03695 [SAR324 cluster bacterium]|nr:hypothetical protein [SAR324 cluster bacterium]